MKILVIVTHPDIEHSVINKRWVEELNKYPGKYAVHQLYKAYPDGNIDIGAEQKLVEQYHHIVFQFPVYWHSCPAFLKKWIDEVLVYGWAYGGKSGYRVGGKKVTLAMSAGVNEYEYAPNEKYRYTLKQLMRPLELTFEYVKAAYSPFFAYYGMERNASEEWVERSVPFYLDFLENFSK